MGCGINTFKSKISYILIGFIVLNISIALIQVHIMFYAVAIILISVPTVLSLFSRTTKRVKIYFIERNPNHFLYRFYTTRSIAYIVDIILGVVLGCITPVMFFLIRLPDYVTVFILLTMAFILNRYVFKGRSYKEAFYERSQQSRDRVVYFFEAVLYPLIWLLIKDYIPDTYIFGTIDNLSGPAHMIGLFVDIMNRTIAWLSSSSSVFVIILVSLMFVNGGILFIGLYKYFDGWTLGLKNIKDCFSLKGGNDVDEESIQK